jgi:hypothetical protein
MKQYRCHLLDAKLRIATTLVITCTDDDQARRLAQDIFDADTGFYFGVELWESGRRIFSYPRNRSRDEGRAVAAVELAEIGQ